MRSLFPRLNLSITFNTYDVKSYVCDFYHNILTYKDY